MANGHGGTRKGAGRKRRAPYKAEPGEVQPLELMLQEMRNRANPMAMRIELATKAAPYCHARLQAITADVDANVVVELVSYLDKSTDSAD